MPYKYKLSEMSKTASPEEAEKELTRKDGEPFAVGQVTYSADGTTKSTIRDIDPTTGAVSWTVTQLPGFEKLYDEVDDFVNVAKRVYQKTKDDKKFRDFYEQARKIRNAIRTHLRNEYPDEYKRMQSRVDEVTRYGGFLKNPPEPTPDSEPFNPTGAVAEFREDLRALFGKYKDELNNRKFIGGVAEIMVNWKSLLRSQMSEEEVEEMSTSGGAGAYQTPYAFRLKKQKPNIKAYKELGYKEVKEAMDGGTLFDYFNKKYIVDDHFHSDDSYIVKREPSGKDQYVIFDYDKDKDQFQIRQLGGYQIDQKEAMKAGMRETSRLARAGMDAYMVDGNYSPTPISIEGLKDIVDHVMGGLSREADIQQAYYARRGPTSGTIDEEGYIVTGKKGKGEAQYGEPYGTEKEARAAMEKILKSIKDIGEKPDAKFGVRKGPLEENNNPGATLGPGPKAGPTGVKDNYYVKAFKYKLVPDKIKGSGIEVKKLF